MKKHLAGLILAVLGAFPALAEQGIHPRPSSDDYPAHQNARTQDTKSIAIGAALIPSRDAKKIFSPDLDRSYVVVEMGVFPVSGGKVKIATTDFALKIGDDLVYPATASTAAASLYHDDRDRNLDRNSTGIHTIATGGVGYETGTDPVTGQRNRGWTTNTGVAVTNEPMGGAYPDPRPPRMDQRNVQADVEDRALPEGEVAHAVAGYLYFPVGSRMRKKAQYLLVYLAGDSPVTMPLEKTGR